VAKSKRGYDPPRSGTTNAVNDIRKAVRVSPGIQYSFSGNSTAVTNGGYVGHGLSGPWTAPHSGIYSIQQGTMSTVNYPVKMVPTPEMLRQPEVMKQIIERLAVVVGPQDKVVMMMDDSLSWEQCHEVQQILNEYKIKGIVVRGGVAGQGFPSCPEFTRTATPAEKRVDVLARIGELWEQRPDLTLSELLAWHQDANVVMSDDDFITATETFFDKVTDGVHRKSQ
jgi:hypothetical protein